MKSDYLRALHDMAYSLCCTSKITLASIESSNIRKDDHDNAYLITHQLKIVDRLVSIQSSPLTGTGSNFKELTSELPKILQELSKELNVARENISNIRDIDDLMDYVDLYGRIRELNTFVYTRKDILVKSKTKSAKGGKNKRIDQNHPDVQKILDAFKKDPDLAKFPADFIGDHLLAKSDINSKLKPRARSLRVNRALEIYWNRNQSKQAK